jgi:hypothetical protein
MKNKGKVLFNNFPQRYSLVKIYSSISMSCFLITFVWQMLDEMISIHLPESVAEDIGKIKYQYLNVKITDVIISSSCGKTKSHSSWTTRVRHPQIEISITIYACSNINTSMMERKGRQLPSLYEPIRSSRVSSFDDYKLWQRQRKDAYRAELKQEIHELIQREGRTGPPR